MASPGPQSALIVEVREAEPAVARRRNRLDASAPLGVPAHITVLYKEGYLHHGITLNATRTWRTFDCSGPRPGVTCEAIYAPKTYPIGVAFAEMSGMSANIELENQTRPLAVT